MKKLLLLLLVLPFFISCSNDDKEEERFTVPVASGIIGTWRVTQVNNGLGYADVPESTSPITVSFKSDGTYTSSNYYVPSGSYKLAGTRIDCYVDGDLYLTHDIYSLSSTEAEFSISNWEIPTTRIKCIKIE